jgi:FkbM family methyltransferase
VPETDLRRQSWYGAKRHVKRALAAPGAAQLAHWALQRSGSGRSPDRVPVPWTVKRVAGRTALCEFTLLEPARCVVAKELYWGKGTRPNRADALALELFGLLARDATRVLDIGAYTGVFSVVAGRVSQARVDAYEIVPENAIALLRNLAANDLLDGRVHVHLEGLGASEHRIRVPTGSGGSALPDFYSASREFTSGVTVRVVTLDSRLHGFAATDRVLAKIDVEGTELDVLTGGARFLDQLRPTMLCELLPGLARTDDLDTLLLDRLGYSAFLLTDAGLRPHDRLQPHETFRDWLLVDTGRHPDVLAAVAAHLPAGPATS